MKHQPEKAHSEKTLSFSFSLVLLVGSGLSSQLAGLRLLSTRQKKLRFALNHPTVARKGTRAASRRQPR
jgi:hypothetical protein